MTTPGTLRRVLRGEPLSKNSHSANWLNALVGAAKPQNALPGTPQFYGSGFQHHLSGDSETGILFLPLADWDTVASGNGPIDDRSLFHGIYDVLGAAGGETDPADLYDTPRMRATLKRGRHLYHTGEAWTDGDGDFVGHPVGSVPFPVRTLTVQDPDNIPEDYDPLLHLPRPWVAGAPAGRQLNGTSAVPDQGGLVCVRVPDDAGIAWVVADTVNLWDAAIIGTLDANSGGIFAGYTEQQAAIILPQMAPADAAGEDKLEDSLARVTIRHRPDDETWADGTYCKLAFNQGEWHIITNTCFALDDLTGLEPFQDVPA